MVQFLTEYHLAGLVMGLFTFLIIGIFHPITIKAEYYFGVKCWWVFLLLGIGGIATAVIVSDVFWSSLCGVFAFTSLWTIKELFQQKERVRKGWFPANPNKKN